MKVLAGGQKRFHGWNEIVSSDLEEIDWEGAGGNHAQTITWDGVELHLNGDYKIQITFTKEDIKALVPRVLTKNDIIDIAELSNNEKINIAKSALAKLSNGDKPDIKALFGMVEAMLSREDVIALLNLTDDEKLNIAQEFLQNMTLREISSRLTAIYDKDDL